MSQKSWSLRGTSLVMFLSIIVVLISDAIVPPALADEDGGRSAWREGGGVPAQTTTVRVLRKFQNAEIDFSAQSSFRLTAVSTREEDKAYSPKFSDEPGAVQLMPVVALDPFTMTNRTSQLPVYVNAAGVTSLGKYLFVIGGVKRVTDGGRITTKPSNEVLVATVDQKTGQLSGVDPLTGTAWRFGPPLPPVWTNYPGDEKNPQQDPGEFSWSGGSWNDTFAPVSEVASPAVVAVPRSPSRPDSGFIYIIGGTVDPGFYNENNIRTSLPSARVQIGKVEKGEIEWLYHDKPGDPIRKEIMIPSPIDEGETYGLTSAAAVAFTTVDNRTFIYLVGGDHTIPERIHHSNYVFYTEVNRQTGLLYKPSSGLKIEGWEIMRDARGEIARIPTPPEAGDIQRHMGLWSATAFIGSSTGGDALYVVGGERLATEHQYRYSNVVYRARITNEPGNPDNGKLTWDTEWKTHLPAGPLINLGSATYATGVYLTGGNKVEGGVAMQPTSDVLISFLNEDLSLGPEGASIYSLPHKEGDPPPLFRSRAQHGMAVVKAVGAGNVQAFVYAIAGHSSEEQKDPDDPYSHQNTNTVLFSKVDLSNQKKIYPPYGWYTSPTIDTLVDDAGQQADLINLEGLYWSAAVSRTREITTDIALEYRVKPSSGGCETVNFGESDWKKFYQADLGTTYSRAGSNIAILQPEDVQNLKNTRACFQYRARLTTNDPEVTPLILNTYLVVSEEKAPDLYGVSKVEADTTGMDIATEIWNLNGSVQKTADADFLRGKFKKFYVDLFVFTPGQSAAPLKNIALPVVGKEGLATINAVGAALHVYSQVDISVMKAGKTFPDPPEKQDLWSGPSQWTDPVTQKPLSKTLREILQEPKFNKTGIYTVCVLVDSFVNTDDAYDWGQTGYVVEANEGNNLSCREVDRETEVSIELETEKQPAEKGPTPVRLVIARNNSSDKALVVHFEVRGTATEGEDYTFNGITIEDGKGTVTIPANQRKVELVLTPINDKFPDHYETVIITLLGGHYMLVRDKMSVTVTIQDDDWMVFLPVVQR